MAKIPIDVWAEMLGTPGRGFIECDSKGGVWWHEGKARRAWGNMAHMLGRTLQALALVLVALLIAPAAHAQETWPTWREDHRPWAYTYREHAAFWRYRTRRVWIARRYVDGDPACLAPVRAVGDERQSIDKAKAAAERAWMGWVRFHHGEKYLDTARWRDVRYLCSRSSVNDTVIGKIQESAGITHSRCQVEARPCRPRAENVGRW